MKKLLAILLMMPVIAFSQANIKHIESQCIDLNSLNDLVKEFDELPFVRGLSNRELGNSRIQHSMVLFVNAKTGSWTIVEKTYDGTYCLLAVGTDFQPVPSNIIDELQNKRQKSKS